MAVKRIILWGAWYGSKNVGDRALLLSITDLLGMVMENVEFIVITDNTARVLEYTTRDLSYSFRPLHTRRQFFQIVNAFAKADLFIFGGGVPFYDDVFHSLAITVLTMLSKVFRVPCVLWAVSSQKVRSVFTELVLRYLIFHASVVSYRDAHTRQLFEKCGMEDGRGKMAADPAFTLRSDDKGRARGILERAGWRPDTPRPLVALTPRLLRGWDGEAHTHYALKTAEESLKEVRVFAAVLDWLWENGYQPVFVPMNTLAPDDDREASHRVMEIAWFGGKALLIDEMVLPRDAANIFSYCRAALVARVHGSVTAFLGRCPMVMYAFDLKHGGIMEQMGLSDWIFDPGRNSIADGVAMMSRLLESCAKIQVEMEEKDRELQKQARVPLDAVVSLLGSTVLNGKA